MKHVRTIWLAALWFAVCSSPAMVLAQEGEEKEVLADVWVFQPKADQWDAFEAGIKQHIAFRDSLDDPREWHVYVPVIGDDMDHYVIRSCCFSWADQDAYIKWGQNEALNENFEKNVGVHVESARHYFSEIDTGHSRWPDDVGDPAYVGVTQFHPKPGRYGNINRSLDEFMGYADKAEWDRPVSFSWTIGGKPTLSIASPFKNYADMAEPSPTFFEMVASQAGGPEEAEKRFKAWADNFHGSTYTIYRHRSDLQPDDES